MSSGKKTVIGVGVSYWEKDTFFAPQDFIIIGGGFTGLWTAIELKKKYKKAHITLLESETIPTGASTKNAGFSCFGSPTELIEDAKLYGENEMWELVAKRYQGLQKIHNTFSYKKIDYENTGGYECLAKKEYTNVADKLRWLNKGLQEITTVKQTFKINKSAKQQFGLTAFDAIIENSLEGCLHPVKLLQVLQAKAVSMGVQLLFGIKVTSMENNDSYTTIGTNNNQFFKSKKVIITTNAFAKQLLPKLDVAPKRGQVFITNEIPNLLLKGCFHYDYGYYYFRNVGKRLLMGGARNADFTTEETTTFAVTDTVQQTLLNFTKKYILPNQPFTIEQQWSGIMGFGATKKPIIEQVKPNVFCAVRLSGIGVALAPMVAEEVAEMVE